MTSKKSEPLDRRYLSALEAYLERGDEAALSAAYELGRRALADGLGVLDMASLHQQALETVLLRANKGEQSQIATGSADFFRELLSPFEMTFRGYRSANEELAALNATLRKQKEALEASNRELESFSYSVSHDLRAPLRSIDGFSQVLLEDCAESLDEDGKKYLGYVRASAQHMAELIDDLLSLARVARTEIHRTDVDLSALAGSVIAQLRRQAPDRNVTVAIEDGIQGYGDARLLAIVFDNLLGNAWKFTSKTADARIEVGLFEREGQTVYFVRDNGAGFDMSYSTKLFGAFQRLHSPKDFEGTGIGLATVQRVVHRLEGRVWAEGKINEGATFYFTLGGERPAR